MPTIGGNQSGPIVATSLVSGGDGYAVGDVISIPDEANGAVDAITPTGSSGPIVTFDLAVGGTGWQEDDTFILNYGYGDAEGVVDSVDLPATGYIASSSLDFGGVNWAPGDTFTVLGGTPRAAGIVDTVDGGGAITAYHLTSAGDDYSVAASVFLMEPSGSGVGGTIDIDSIAFYGPIATTSLHNTGLEWKVGDVFHVAGNGSGNGAFGVVDTIDGTSSGFDGSFVDGTISDGGSGYEVGDTVYIQPSGNAANLVIDSVDGGGAALTYHVTWMGKGYQTGIWECHGGTGSGMEIDITEIALYGSIVTYHLTTAGNGYRLLESFLEPQSPSFGSGATVDIDSAIAIGAIATCHLTDPGTAYFEASGVEIVATGDSVGSGASVDITEIDPTSETGVVTDYHLEYTGEGSREVGNEIEVLTGGVGSQMSVRVDEVDSLDGDGHVWLVVDYKVASV